MGAGRAVGRESQLNTPKKKKSPHQNTFRGKNFIRTKSDVPKCPLAEYTNMKERKEQLSPRAQTLSALIYSSLLESTAAFGIWRFRDPAFAQMRTLWAERDQPITLPCSLSPPNYGYMLEWRRGDSLFFSANGNSSGNAAASFKGRIARANALDLTIHAAQPSDQDSYQCSIGGDGDDIRHGTPVQLVVKASPQIHFPLKGQNEFFVAAGGELRVECLAEGIPPPQIYWRRESGDRLDSPLLEIQNAADEHLGKYICLATNSEGTVEMAIFVGFAQSPFLSESLGNKTVTEGGAVFWRCSANGSPFTLKYVWTHNGETIFGDLAQRSHFENGDFGITKVNRKDSGEYECEVSNGISPNAIGRAHLNVQFGDSGELDCSMDANPQPIEYNWSKNGQILDNRMPILRLRNLNSTDSGIYGCWTENLIGRSEIFSFHLIVAASPQFVTEPPPRAVVKSGELFVAECSGFGDPPPIQFWLRNSKKISGSTLRIPSVSHSDFGLYECILSNPVASVSRNLSLIVLNTRPQCPKEIQIKCFGEESVRIQISPGFDGGRSQIIHLDHQIVNSTDWKEVGIIEDRPIELNDLGRFSFHRFRFRTLNDFGETLCPTEIFQSCSVPKAPKNLQFSEISKLKWSPSPDAFSYRISHRSALSEPIRILAETSETSVEIPKEILKESIEFRVESVRIPFGSSEAATIGRPIEFSPKFSSPSIVFALICLLLLGFCFFFWRRRKSNRRRSTKQMSSANRTVAQFETLEQTEREEIWGSEIFERPFDDFPFDEEDDDQHNPHLINEMLRDKYIYAHSTLDNIRDEILVDQLKDEMNHFAL